uniref:Uncharacterized protein n=1 Tax=Noctiluca scintillans TaxID=2966 RepID=A0A7S1FIS7_NOCSC|mmetsp:Transcript_7834/g.21508  ORF Transcript_7834/g.21508 Transcript_7834/m.21508 type:complete len:451 (+) Transcript_7834:57-1409(+)
MNTGWFTPPSMAVIGQPIIVPLGSQQQVAAQTRRPSVPLQAQQQGQYVQPRQQAAPVPVPAAPTYVGSARAPLPSAPEPAPEASPDKPSEPWLLPEAQLQRKTMLGLLEPQAAKFVAENEFISLGCYCGVSRSLQCLGLKKYSYPFDWIRSPGFGIIHCLETSFADFLTFTVQQDAGNVGMLFGKAHWGGSFWHHDPTKPKTKTDFIRRAERLYGNHEVPPEKARCFVWAINSTRELDDSVRLRDTLCQALPMCEVRLLVLIDLQTTPRPICISAEPNILFCTIHESVLANNGVNWTMQKQSELYAEAIAFAIRYWSRTPGTEGVVAEVDSLRDICSMIDSFDGGVPATELYFPRRFQGQEMAIQRVHRPSHEPSVVPVANMTNGTDPDERAAHNGLRKLLSHVITPNQVPIPVEHEMLWAPGVSRGTSRAASRSASPAPSRQSVAPVCY